tara:strand:+ start:409 stop:1356 length:948 start_codon:yes stop_codon:yes gene_type:complete
MAKFGFKKVLPQISSKDLKKAIVTANEKLKKSNDALSSRIKDAEKLAKSKEKEVKGLEKTLKSRLKEMNVYDNSITKIKAEIFSYEKQCSELKKVIKGLKGDESSLSKNVTKLENLNNKLKESVASLELRKLKADKIARDIGNIEVRQTVAESDLNKILKSQEIVKSEIKSAKIYYERIKSDTKIKQKELRGKISTLEAKLISISDIASQEQIKADDVLRIINEELDHKNAELGAVKSLVSKIEYEYIAWEEKVRNAKKEVDIEKRKVQTVKDAYEKWRITRLEQEAKKKLKDKIETIDMAGLKEILGKDVLNNG